MIIKVPIPKVLSDLQVAAKGARVKTSLLNYSLRQAYEKILYHAAIIEHLQLRVGYGQN